MKELMGSLKVYCDGACHNKQKDTDTHNQMGIGVSVQYDGEEVATLSKYIGDGTNNIAEYNALIEGLKLSREIRFLLMEEQFEVDEVVIHSDSQIIVNQYNGDWECREEVLKKLLNIALLIKLDFPIKVIWIPRKENSRADELSKKRLIDLGYRDKNGKVVTK